MRENSSFKPTPRVHIKYEVETEDGIEEKELPFVIGVIGDFAGDSHNNQPCLQQREFLTVTQENFDSIMHELNPTLKIRVDNKLNSNDEELILNLKFNRLKDFEPDQIIEQIEPLRKLKLAREKLRTLVNKTECSESLETILSQHLKDFNLPKAQSKKIDHSKAEDFNDDHY